MYPFDTRKISPDTNIFHSFLELDQGSIVQTLNCRTMGIIVYFIGSFPYLEGGGVHAGSYLHTYR